MINKALRTHDTDILYNLRFFIKDLHHQLCAEYLSKKHAETITTVYRGQEMSGSEFQKILKTNVGGLLSISNFLSTSTDSGVAACFTEGGTNLAVVSLLYGIDVVPNLRTNPYANIDNLAIFSRRAKYFFRWTEDEDEQLVELAEHMRKEIGGTSSLINLGRLMSIMGELTKAEQFYQVLLNDTSIENDPHRPAVICNNLEIIHDKQHNSDQSLAYYERSLKYELSTVSPMQALISSLYNNIGSIHCAHARYTEALPDFNKALEIRLATLPPNDRSPISTPFLTQMVCVRPDLILLIHPMDPQHFAST
ncbi:unnamed protein product [Didymodactylos carnosus]|uniref:Uncharacterized protein n=1 Tax=Didymodactylos carnosus TaxID=1234261 RepID=A0A814I1B6_9BILA|nr:unnamed protein product [Didymodactylos carnosus]CAF1127395.1 unnamed protein product [Didymodactylos carnosus]CAF3788868.1 unnamed protein product [Didymodactylos carnosus]CAF3906612.1 unnamed protein product [Didymodactylos carnosus]